MYRAASVLLALAASARANDPLLTQNSQGSDCPLAGPAYPAPAYLSDSPLLSDAVHLFEAQLSNNSLGLDLQPTDAAWAVAFFSAKENRTLYERYYTPPKNVGVPKVDGDSIFRLASVSKVFTVWTFLVAAGESYFSHPITEYVPELANRSTSYSDALYDDIEHVRWEDVTLGELMSQSAGIARDVNLDDLSVNYPTDELEAIGLPALNTSAIPTCGANITQPACTRKEFLDQLLQKTPIWPTSHSPAYSNIAYTLLAYALEAITGKDLEAAMTDSIFTPLGMRHSSYTKVPSHGGVIPGGNPLTSGWNRNLGADSPGGSVYMSMNDLVTAGQSILQSRLLKPAQTRRWLKPWIQTGYLGAAVGAPWEMSFVEAVNNRLVQYYTKDGDVNDYHATLVLSPEHEVGFAVLTAGPEDSEEATLVRTALKIAIGEILMPAAEVQARAEAGGRFDGTYVDEASNSSATIVAGYNGHPGLTVRSLVSNGVPMIGPGTSPDGMAAAGLSVGNTTRLFPTTLKTVRQKENGGGRYESRLGFRAAFETQAIPAGTVQDPCILNWANLDGVTYGKEGLDDWVFVMDENETVVAIDIRMLRVSLKRKS